MKPVWAIVYGSLDASRSSRAALSRALDKVTTLSGPERLVWVGLEQDRPWWAPTLSRFPGAVVIEQPLDRGSGTAMIAAATQIFRRDPGARVVLVDFNDPAGSELAWAQVVEAALDPLVPEDRVLLFGAGRPAGETQDLTAPAAVRLGTLLFETDPATREGWLERGALTVMPEIVSSVPALLSAAQATHPRTLQSFLTRLQEPGALGPVLDEIYPFCTEIDLHRDLLAGAPQQLWMRRVPAAVASSTSGRPLLLAREPSVRLAPVERALAV